MSTKIWVHITYADESQGELYVEMAGEPFVYHVLMQAKAEGLILPESRECTVRQTGEKTAIEKEEKEVRVPRVKRGKERERVLEVTEVAEKREFFEV